MNWRRCRRGFRSPLAHRGLQPTKPGYSRSAILALRASRTAPGPSNSPIGGASARRCGTPKRKLRTGPTARLPRLSSSPAMPSGRCAFCPIPAPMCLPDGLANSSGLVGKNLMFPSPLADRRLVRSDARRLSRPRGTAYGPRNFTRRTAPAGSCAATPWNSLAARGWWGQWHADRPPVLGCGTPPRLSQAVLPPHRHGGDLRRRAGGVQHRDRPPVLKDSNGIPAPRITYRLSENSRRMLDHAVERGSEIRRGSATGGKPTFVEKP